MKLKKNLLKPLMILLSFLTFSCATVPDVPVCKEISEEKGWCSWTIKSGGFYVDEENPYAFDPNYPEELYTWWEYKPMMISLPPYSLQEIKKYIIKQCRKTKKCKGDIGEWFSRLDGSK